MLVATTIVQYTTSNNSMGATLSNTLAVVLKNSMCYLRNLHSCSHISKTTVRYVRVDATLKYSDPVT